MSQVAANILSYSSDAGGQLDGSYYAAMLQWCGDWWDAEGDSKKQDEIRQNIIDITEDQLDSIDGIQLYLGKVKKGLVDFDTKCGDHTTKLEGLEDDMTSLLNEELGNIAKLQREIDIKIAEISSCNAKIDADRLQQELTATYIWILVFGTISGPVVFAVYEGKIKELRKKIGELQDIIDSDNENIQLHTLLQGNVTSMKVQATSLSDTIGPAIETIKALEGSWDVMKDQLQGLHDNVAKQEVKVPRFALEQVQLNNIIDAWNNLHTYMITYIKNANITPSVKQMSLDDYVKELDNVK